MTGVLIKSVHWDAYMHTGKTPCERDSRDQGNESMSKEWQILLANHQNLGEKYIYLEQVLLHSLQKIPTLLTS